MLQPSTKLTNANNYRNVCGFQPHALYITGHIEPNAGADPGWGGGGWIGCLVTPYGSETSAKPVSATIKI